MSENQFNFNATNQQNIIGDNNTVSQQIGEAKLTDAEVIKGFESAVYSNVEITARMSEPAADVFQEITALDPEAEESTEVAKTLYERFKEVVVTAGPKATKAVIVFATEAAKQYADSNPIIKGLIAAAQSLSE